MMSLADWGWTTEIDSGVEGFPSVPVFRLLNQDFAHLNDLLAAAHEGNEDWEAFDQALDECTAAWDEAIQDMRASFLEQRFYKLEARTEKVQLKLEDLLNASEHDDFDPERLAQLAEEVLGEVAELHWAHLATGAGGVFNPVNVFRQLAVYGEQALLYPDMWAEAVERCRGFYGGALAEVEQSDLAGSAAVKPRKEALEDTLVALDALEKDPQNWEEPLRSLSSSLLRLTDAVNSYSEDRRTTPTEFLWLNQAFHAFTSLARDCTEDDLAVTSLSLLMARLEAEEIDWRLSQGDPALSVSEELFQSRGSLLKSLQKVAEGLERFLEEGEEEELATHLEALARTGKELAAEDVLAKAYRLEKSKLACPFCGHRNDVDVRICGGCQASMPKQMHQHVGESSQLQLGEGGLENGVVVTEGLQELAQACLDLQAGKLQADDFKELLRVHLEGTEQALDRCRRVEVPEAPAGLAGQEREFSEGLERFGNENMLELEQALEMCSQGLHMLLTTADEVDVLVQKRGLRVYSEGCQTIWRSRKAFEVVFPG